MAHIPQAELARRLADAAQFVEVGARYTHYKDTRNAYVVKALAILEATEEVAVVYEGQYGEHITFIRPLVSWLELAERQGKLVPRFSKV